MKITQSLSHWLVVALAVISYIVEALKENVIISKRDIYYRDVALFKSQGTVDKMLVRLSETLEIPRYINSIF